MKVTDFKDDIVGDKSTFNENDTDRGEPSTRVSDAFIQWALISGLVCFGFACVASFVIALKLWLVQHPEDGIVFRLVLKGLFFSVLFGICVLLVHRFRGRVYSSTPKSMVPESSPWGLYSVVGILILAVCYPMLHEYPWTAPDELYHLVVARNIAEHSAYASGNPTIGFNYFDHYDSVGSPVLGAVALAFKLFSPSIESARMVMATFYLGFGLGIFILVRSNWGLRAAALSVAITTLSFGSIYLARSLYGEVPALMFLVWSMVCWEKSFDLAHSKKWAFVGGVLWGFGILSKSFLLLSAFPIIGVWLFDRLTTKRIGFTHILLPGAGGLVVLSVWYGILAYYSYLKTDDISMLYFYRHYLMFGFPSSSNGLGWFMGQPVYTLSMLAILLFAISQLFIRLSNPALRVLLLTSELYAFWWVFFTPATIPRYMWYSCAILGLFSGPLVVNCYQVVCDRIAPRFHRLGHLLVIVVIGIPCGFRLVEQLNLIYVQDQAADERHLAAYLEELPDDIQIGTNDWSVCLGMDFMAQRTIYQIEDFSQIDDKYSVIIYNRGFNSVESAKLEGAYRIGRYAVVHTE